MNKDAALKILNHILELELAGIVYYTHYAMMVYGPNRIPVAAWMNKQADEGLVHARLAGELVTWLGGHPSLGIGPLVETKTHDIGDILRESLVLETEILNNYYELFILVKDKDIRLEEYARNQIVAETAHQDAVNKMLRKPNQIESFVSEGQMIK